MQMGIFIRITAISIIACSKNLHSASHLQRLVLGYPHAQITMRNSPR
jgi:hypothetical protein